MEKTATAKLTIRNKEPSWLIIDGPLTPTQTLPPRGGGLGGGVPGRGEGLDRAAMPG